LETAARSDYWLQYLTEEASCPLCPCLSNPCLLRPIYYGACFPSEENWGYTFEDIEQQFPPETLEKEMRYKTRVHL
jgi:hypothetical protein